MWEVGAHMMKFLKIILVLLVFPFVISTEAKANPEENLFIQFVPNNQVKLVGKFDEGPDCQLNKNYDIQYDSRGDWPLGDCRKSIDDLDHSNRDYSVGYYLQVMQDQQQSKCIWARLILKKSQPLNNYGRNPTHLAPDQLYKVTNTTLGAKHACRQ